MVSLVTEHISFSVCQIILLESKFHKLNQLKPQRLLGKTEGMEEISKH